jgi:hypothetical protein
MPKVILREVVVSTPEEVRAALERARREGIVTLLP